VLDVPPSERQAGWTPTNWAALAGVAVVAFAVHARSISFGFVDLDDRDLIVDDQAFLVRAADLVRAFGRSYLHVVDARHPYYRPLVTASYLLDAQWSGVHPFGYHLTNVLLHVLASILCLALLLRLGFAPLAAVLAALLFAVHPAVGSAVAWIPGRNDSLLAVFALGAWIAFISHVERPSWRPPAIHLALFVLALFTKETAAMIPLVCGAHVLLLDAAAPRRALRLRRLLSVAPGWVAAAGLRWIARPLPMSDWRNAPSEIAHHLRLLPAGLQQVVLPFNPSLVGVVSDSPVAGGMLAASVAAFVAIAARGVRARMVALGAVAFVLWSLPSLAVPGTLVLGHRLYLPAVGIVIVAAEMIRALAFRLEPRVLGAFGGAIVACLGLVAASYEETFRDRRAFARAAVDAAPGSPVAHFCMGSAAQRDGDDDRALVEYARAIELGSLYVVHNNVAVIHMARGRWTDAERELRKELAADPAYAVAYRNLAIVLRHEGRLEEAAEAEARAGELGGESASNR
jgi:protein O-mannosyl-transferase